MQVTHESAFVTHAVIAPAQTQDFSISSSAEFFQILSSTLYTNQKLAVVREVICNAWDAHIAAGCTDVPIEITLDEQKLVIRDFGLGISKDQMGPIYGTYGASTKKNDGQQTGGFGLGCKAPFAYTDLFEVESFCQGLRTLYTLSKSSAERQGKPGITPILTLATMESGLKVSIPLKQGDLWSFENLVNQVVRNGDINATVNGVSVEKRISFPPNGQNWVVTQKRVIHGDNACGIYVRYGNVIYPIPKHPDYGNEYEKILRFIRDMSAYVDSYRVVLMARPHSIAVTPSRESLSLQEYTVKALKELLIGFEKVITQDILGDQKGILKKAVTRATEAGLIGELMTDQRSLPGFRRHGEYKYPDTITETDELAACYMTVKYPYGTDFHREAISLRVASAIELKVGFRGHLTEFRTKFEEEETSKSRDHRLGYKWYLRRVAGPLMAKLKSDPIMDEKRLFVLDPHHRQSAQHNLVPAREYSLGSTEGYFPLLRNIVVFTLSRPDLRMRIRKFPEMETLGDERRVFVYVAPRQPTKLQQMRDFFTSRGYTVLDLSVPQPWDEPAPQKVKRVSVPKPKLAGYPALEGAAGDILKGTSPRIDLCFVDGAPRVTAPTCYLREERSRALDRPLSILNFSQKTSNLLVKLYGKECAVTSSTRQEKELKDMGILSLEQRLVTDMVEHLTMAPHMQAYWSESFEAAVGTPWGYLGFNDSQNMGTILRESAIRQALGLNTMLDSRDRLILSVWQGMLEYQHRWDQGELTKVKDAIAATQLSPIMQEIKNTWTDSFLVKVIDFRELRKTLDNLSPLPATRANQLSRLQNFIKSALLG